MVNVRRLVDSVCLTIKKTLILGRQVTEGKNVSGEELSDSGFPQRALWCMNMDTRRIFAQA